MILKPIHIEFYRAKKVSPQWASLCYTKDGLKHQDSHDKRMIDACVNAHYDAKNDSRCDAHNIIVLCRFYEKQGTLLESLKTIIARNGSNKRRVGYARKWAERIAKRYTTP